jgi:hypothetical protein
MLFVVPLHVKKESASSGFGPRTQAATRINNKRINNVENHLFGTTVPPSQNL